jgi:hypothetical protein
MVRADRTSDPHKRRMFYVIFHTLSVYDVRLEGIAISFFHSNQSYHHQWLSEGR